MGPIIETGEIPDQEWFASRFWRRIECEMRGLAFFLLDRGGAEGLPFEMEVTARLRAARFGGVIDGEPFLIGA